MWFANAALVRRVEELERKLTYERDQRYDIQARLLRVMDHLGLVELPASTMLVKKSEAHKLRPDLWPPPQDDLARNSVK